MDGWTVALCLQLPAILLRFFFPPTKTQVLPPHLGLLGRIQWCSLWQHKRDTTLKLSRPLCSIIGLMHRQHYVCIHCTHQHNRCNSTRNSKIHNDFMSSIFTIYLRTQESTHTRTHTMIPCETHSCEWSSLQKWSTSGSALVWTLVFDRQLSVQHPVGNETAALIPVSSLAMGPWRTWWHQSLPCKGPRSWVCVGCPALL